MKRLPGWTRKYLRRPQICGSIDSATGRVSFMRHFRAFRRASAERMAATIARIETEQAAHRKMQRNPRCGELLKELDGRPANARKQSNGDGTLISQKSAAEDAGLSKRQKDTAVRVANVPEPEFERQVESPDAQAAFFVPLRFRRLQCFGTVSADGISFTSDPTPPVIVWDTDDLRADWQVNAGAEGAIAAMDSLFG